MTRAERRRWWLELQKWREPHQCYLRASDREIAEHMVEMLQIRSTVDEAEQIVTSRRRAVGIPDRPAPLPPIPSIGLVLPLRERPKRRPVRPRPRVTHAPSMGHVAVLVEPDGRTGEARVWCPQRRVWRMRSVYHPGATCWVLHPGIRYTVEVDGRSRVVEVVDGRIRKAG